MGHFVVVHPMMPITATDCPGACPDVIGSDKWRPYTLLSHIMSSTRCIKMATVFGTRKLCMHISFQRQELLHLKSPSLIEF